MIELSPFEFKWRFFAVNLSLARGMVTDTRLGELPSLPIDGAEFGWELPIVTAVYFICRPGPRPRPSYIGRAMNLRSRWTASGLMGHDHHKLAEALAHKGLLLRWLEVPREHLGIVEIMLLQHYKPPWNNHRG